MIFPFSVWDCLWLAPLACILDLLFGDPALPWSHPVCLIGRLLTLEERLCRKWAGNSRKRELAAGFAAVAFTTLGCFVTVWLLVLIPYIGWLLAVYLSWAGLAGGCLLTTGREVLARLEDGTVEEGRKAVSWLVSRDVSELDKRMLRKTLADTLGENFTDAFLSPFFWLLLAGPAGLWFYKAASTLDSMWGYMAPPWRYLGRAAASLDDFLACIPARLSAPVLFLTDKLGKLAGLAVWSGKWPGFAKIRSDARKMPSPNSGWSMAACAWLCSGRMAGPSVYSGELVKKGWLGPEDAPDWQKSRLDAQLRLMQAGFAVGALSLWLLFAGLDVLVKLLLAALP